MLIHIWLVANIQGENMGIFATLGTAIISGITGYFKDKNEIKKVEV